MINYGKIILIICFSLVGIKIHVILSIELKSWLGILRMVFVPSTIVTRKRNIGYNNAV